jgi:hypothetical protein
LECGDLPPLSTRWQIPQCYSGRKLPHSKQPFPLSRERFESTGSEPVLHTPDECAARIKREIAEYTKPVPAANLCNYLIINIFFDEADLRFTVQLIDRAALDALR